MSFEWRLDITTLWGFEFSALWWAATSTLIVQLLLFYLPQELRLFLTFCFQILNLGLFLNGICPYSCFNNSFACFFSHDTCLLPNNLLGWTPVRGSHSLVFIWEVKVQVSWWFHGGIFTFSSSLVFSRMPGGLNLPSWGFLSYQRYYCTSPQL